MLGDQEGGHHKFKWREIFCQGLVDTRRPCDPAEYIHGVDDRTFCTGGSSISAVEEGLNTLR